LGSGSEKDRESGNRRAGRKFRSRPPDVHVFSLLCSFFVIDAIESVIINCSYAKTRKRKIRKSGSEKRRERNTKWKLDRAQEKGNVSG
jgi:hypothetical protein